MTNITCENGLSLAIGMTLFVLSGSLLPFTNSTLKQRSRQCNYTKLMPQMTQDISIINKKVYWYTEMKKFPGKCHWDVIRTQFHYVYVY